MIKISAVIITYNEEKHIARCLDSLKSLADEIVVVDSFSNDRTKAICLEHRVRFIEHPFISHIDQKNFAVAQAKSDYILSLDGDEYLSTELTHSINEVLKTWPYPAYTMNRLNQYGSKWIRHGSWYPDKKIRLWDRRKGVFGGVNPHDHVILEAGTPTMHLHGDLLHLAYQNASQLLSKAQQYSGIFAGQMAFKQRVSPFKIFYKTFFAFFKSYFLKVGFLDGYEGLVIATSIAHGVFFKYAKLLEANRSIDTTLIITTYNRKDALEVALLSALELNPMPKEIIVANDGSLEDTQQLIEKYLPRFNIPLRHCWHEDHGPRLSAIRNRAIAVATFPYIIMTNSDTVIPSQFIGDHQRAAWKGRMVRASESIDGVHGANMSYWKSDAIAVNGFNEDFIALGAEDSDFVLRMTNSGVRNFHMKFIRFANHLSEKDTTRETPPAHQQLPDKAVPAQSVRCKNGIDKYIASNSNPFP